MINIKSFVSTSSMIMLVPADGSDVIKLAGRNLLDDTDVMKMTANIVKNGSTPFINSSGNALTLLEMALQLELPVSVDPETEKIVITAADEVPVSIEKIEDHITHAYDNKLDNMKALMDRLKQHKDSGLVADIISFISNTCMPITKEGFVIGLRRNVYKNNKVFDGHSCTVPQEVGSRITMDDALINKSRDVCNASGLHISTQSYFASYCGAVGHLVLVDPLHIVSVPYRETTKLRCSSYVIVHEMTKTQFESALKCDFTPLDGVISSLVGGYMPTIINEVSIKKKGTGKEVIVTNVKAGSKNKPADKVVPAKNVSTVKRKADLPAKKTDIAAVGTFGQLAKLYELFTNSTYNGKLTNYRHMLLIKRKQKKSWEKLGFSADDVKIIVKFESDNKPAIRSM